MRKCIICKKEIEINEESFKILRGNFIIDKMDCLGFEEWNTQGYSHYTCLYKEE